MNELEQETAGLLGEVRAFAKRFAVITDAQATAFAAWVLHTWAMGASECTPYLAITSAEKRSGKTRLGIEIAGALVANPLPMANISPAVLYRKLAEGDLTLLMDEVDTVWTSRGDERNEELRGLINAGHKRDGGVVWRCVGVGSQQKAQAFPVYGAKILCGIGALPDTVADRSIPLRMKRRARSEPIERARPSQIKSWGHPIRERLASWGPRATPILREVFPELPHELDDRAQDFSEPLLAIAQVAGWTEVVEAALVELCSEQQEDEHESRRVLVLADIRSAFEESGKARLTTVELLQLLAADESGPWAAFHGPGTPITARALAKLLAPFEVKPKVMRVGDGTLRGYERNDFADVFERYVPGLAVTRETPATLPGFAGESGVAADDPFRIAIRNTDRAETRESPAKAPLVSDVSPVAAVAAGDAEEDELF